MVYSIVKSKINEDVMKKISVIFIIISLFLFSACTISYNEMVACERLCDNNGGIYHINVDLYGIDYVKCNDGATYSRSYIFKEMEKIKKENK